LDAHRPMIGRDGLSVSSDVQNVASGVLAHLDAAYNLASWLVGSEHDAQDIVQEAYLRAMRSVATFRGGDQRSWILTIVRNACFDWLRRDKASPFDELDDQASLDVSGPEADPSQILQRAEDVQRVRAAIAQLPPAIREAVVLRELEGLSYKEIAAVTGVPMGTVMSRLARARGRLAQLLSNDPVVQRAKQ
jgi:RNA polymerase sigma-70 factor (ECF subfamily)